MAANLSLRFKFSNGSRKADNADLVLEYTAEFADDPLPSSPPQLTISVKRLEGAKARGRVRVLAPDVSGALDKAKTVGEDDNGTVNGAVVDSTPQRTADSFIWRFFVTSQPGGRQPTLAVTADAPPAKSATATTLATAAPLPKPSSAATTMPLVPSAFPRLVVGIDSATVPKDTFSPFNAAAANIQKCLERVFARLTDSSFVATALSASLGGSSITPKVEPSAAQSGATSVQDAELAWANQLAVMQICTPYAGPNAAYHLNDDDLLVRGVNSPGADPEKAVFPICFACQHLGTFAVAARGRALVKTNKKGDRFLLLGAGSKAADTWTTNKMGKWFVTTPAPAPPQPPPPGPPQPFESTDGGKGDPTQLVPDELLETSQLLFQIKNVTPTHPFGAAAIFVYANRPALSDGDCSIANGVETCLLRGADGNLKVEDVPVFEDRDFIDANGQKKTKKVLTKNADGTLKTVRQTARTVWNLSSFVGVGADGKPAPLLADNTAGAHMAYVLRSDNRLQLFQMLDTGGINVPNRGQNVVAVPPVQGFHGGIFDDPSTNRVNPGTAPKGHDPFRGVGVIEAITPEQADDLLKHVQNVLQKARPMGLCRLVLLRRDIKVTFANCARFKEPGQGYLLYASPALPMYDGTIDTQTFPISRCLWALREFPDNANVEAMWLFYVPQGPLGRAMIDAPRGARVTALANAAGQLLKGQDRTTYFKKNVLQTSRVLADFTFPILNATCDADGQVRLVATYKTKLLPGRGMSLLHGLEGRYGTASLLPLDQSFLRGGQSDSSFPPYFTAT